MASLRGSQPIWVAKAVTGSGAGTDISSEVNIGVGVNVCLFINNTGGGSGTFKIQTSVPAGGQVGAGLNIAPDTWYDYSRAGGSVLSLVVAAGATLAVDLSPFSPEYLRLVSTTGSTTVSAYIASIGVN